MRYTGSKKRKRFWLKLAVAIWAFAVMLLVLEIGGAALWQ